MHLPRPALALVTVLTLPISQLAFAQGPLTPSAAPAASMKSLDQVEPRIDLATLVGDASATHVISAPGSYFLSRPLTAIGGRAGIAIASPDVTVDLRGFSITAGAGSTIGIELRAGASSVTIHNGSVAGFSAGGGVSVTGGGLANVRIKDLHIRACGSGITVIAGFNGLMVEDVVVTNCAGSGIDLFGVGEVRRCVVDSTLSTNGTTLYGIRAAVVSDCRVQSVVSTGSNTIGISGTVVANCSVGSVSGITASGTTGISAGTVTACQVATVSISGSGAVNGIAATGKVTDCTVTGIGTTGGGTVTGISGGSVSGCRVSNVGGSGNNGALNGISAGQGNVQNCSVNTFGSTAGFAVQGISAGQVLHCWVGNGTGGAALVGIVANDVEACQVEGLQQTGGSSVCAGISGVRINQCGVAVIVGSTTNATYGISAYSLATACTASAISHGGTTAAGFRPGSNSQTIDCVAQSAQIGFLASQGGVVIRGCRADAGIGIRATGTRNRLEDNTISNCTTGILADIDGTSGLIVRNRVTDCATRINAAATWQVGAIVNTASITTANAWANFTD